MASTTVPTSFEHDNMITFRLRSISISSFSVSMPFISGIKTSRMMKSGRSPFFTLFRASLPELTASTWNPSTSRRVCKYFRILGSSSTTRIFSFSAISSSLSYNSYKNLWALSLIHGQKKCKSASSARIAFHPDLSAMRLNEAFCDCQPQSHSGSISVHSHEILENFLMVLGRDARTGVLHADFHAVWSRQAKSSPLFHGSHGCHAALPEVRSRRHRDGPATGSVLERIVEQIRRNLLDLLIIEAECRDRRIDVRFQPHALALKCFRPALRKLVQAIAQVVLSELQNQFAAFQRTTCAIAWTSFRSAGRKHFSARACGWKRTSILRSRHSASIIRRSSRLRRICSTMRSSTLRVVGRSR